MAPTYFSLVEVVDILRNHLWSPQWAEQSHVLLSWPSCWTFRVKQNLCVYVGSLPHETEPLETVQITAIFSCEKGAIQGQMFHSLKLNNWSLFMIGQESLVDLLPHTSFLAGYTVDFERNADNHSQLEPIYSFSPYCFIGSDEAICLSLSDVDSEICLFLQQILWLNIFWRSD